MVILLWVKKHLKFVQFVPILKPSLRFAQLITKSVLENKPHVGLIFCADVTKGGTADDAAREAFITPQDALVNE